MKTFLKSSAVLALPDYGYNETSLYGVDWNSSYCVTTGNVRHIEVPMLMMGMTGSYEYIAAEHLYNMAERCTDKTIAFVEGAGHMFTVDMSTEHDWGDIVRICFDYADQWIARRFI